jgi:hypothetical protein
VAIMPTGACSTVRKGWRHEPAPVPLAALRQALRRSAAVDTEARAAASAAVIQFTAVTGCSA